MLYNTANPHGGDIYGDKVILDYSANTNPLGTPEGVRRAVCEAAERLDRYPDPYCRELTAALAGHEGVPRDYLICGNGAAEVIYAYCEAVGGKGAELAPTFSEYTLGFLKGESDDDGRKMVRYTLKKEKGFAPDHRLLDFIKAEQPAVLFLCHPNNPTGIPMEEGLLRETIALCGELGTRVFLDECFLDLSNRGWDAKEILAENPHLFILKAFTKSYGMAGVRLGYGMTADTALLKSMSEAVQPWNASTPAQAAGVAALKETEFLTKTCEIIETERQWLFEKLESLGFYHTDSAANYILFEGPENLAEELKKQGIAIRKCENYHGLGSGWYRIAVRLHEENEKLMEAMRQIVCERK